MSTRYAPDARALALLRIGIALVVMADLVIRGSDLRAHYTSEGMWPAFLVPNFGWKQGFWSLHTGSDTFGWEILLFSLHGLAAFCLLIGYKTRLAGLLTWLFTVSLHNRNLFVLQSGDDLLRLVLLWGLFLPWHLHYAIDARKNKAVSAPSPLAGLGYLLLLASVYFFTAILKQSAEWHQEGTAVYYALSLEQLRLPLGDWLYQFPSLMRFLTHLVLLTEFCIPILLLWPSRKGWLRGLAFLLLLMLHTGIGLTLYVGLFSVIPLVAGFGLLPAAVMDRLERAAGKKRSEAKTPNGSAGITGALGSAACLFLISLSLIINLSSVNWFPYELRPEFRLAENSLRLNQYWGMFSPSILKLDGWFVYQGVDAVGRQWDLRRNEDYVDFSKPEHIVNLYSSERWRKLAENMQNDGFTFLRPTYGKYVLQTWNRRHPEKKCVTLNLYFMQERSLPDYKISAPEKKLFCVCTDD